MKQFIVVTTLSLLLFSCGNKVENREMDEYVSAFLNENTSIAFFGKVDVNTLLDKADYKAIPKYGNIIGSEKNELIKMLNEHSSIYYALEGPFKENVPAAFYGFVDVKKADGLEQKLTKNGFYFEKSGDFSYTVSGDLTIGIRNDLAIIISKDTEYIAKDELSKAFEKCAGDLSEGKVNDILAQKGDVVLGLSIASIYATSNTELSNLNEATQEKVKELVKDSYTQTTFSFENGAAIIETKNFFSDALKKELFFKSDRNASVVSKLGQGNARFGLSMNFEMNKLQSFIDKYSPNGINNLAGILGGEAQFVLMQGGKKPLPGLFSGEIAVVGLGEVAENGSLTPHFNIFVGLGKKGNGLANFVRPFFSMGTMKTEIDSKGITCYTSPLYAPVNGKKVNLPEGAENFGKEAITAFINFEGLDVSSFDVEGAGKVLNIIQYITFEMNENGSKIYIKAKKGEGNILKQSADFFIHEFEDRISGL